MLYKKIFQYGFKFLYVNLKEIEKLYEIVNINENNETLILKE